MKLHLENVMTAAQSNSPVVQSKNVETFIPQNATHIFSLDLNAILVTFVHTSSHIHSTSSTMATHTVSTTLNYYLPPSLGGVDTIYLGTASEKRRKHQPRTVLVTDIRGRETQFALDKQGFQIVQHESSEKDFDDDAKIKEAYYAECAALLKTV